MDKSEMKSHVALWAINVAISVAIVFAGDEHPLAARFGGAAVFSLTCYLFLRSMKHDATSKH